MPGRGFANCVRAVRKLARPATSPVCQELAARGADRLSATMKRGTGLSLGLSRPLARAAVERREASASPKRGARREDTQGQGVIACQAGPRNLLRAFRRSASLFLEAAVREQLEVNLGARTKSAARERDFFFSPPAHARSAWWGGVRGGGHFLVAWCTR